MATRRNVCVGDSKLCIIYPSSRVLHLAKTTSLAQTTLLTTKVGCPASLGSPSNTDCVIFCDPATLRTKNGVQRGKVLTTL